MPKSPTPLAAALAAAGAFATFEPAAAQMPAEPVSTQLVDALQGVFGSHAGRRRSGAKGFCATGEFTATGEGERLTSAPTLRRGSRLPVVARFSIGGGSPAAPDNGPSVRGLSFSIDGQHEFVLINTPVFTARTPESFVAFLKVRAPDPQTRQMNAPAIAAANAANPDWMPQIAYLRDNPPPASYATSAYFGVNSFVFVTPQGGRQHARWTFEPVAGRIGLTPEERQARGPNFLEAELRGRLAQGPAEWRVLLQMPEAGDPLNDAVAAWPANRPTVEVARLRITAIQPAGGPAPCDGQMFNPTLLPDGIEPSMDPILTIRAEAYAVSLSRRSQ
ncbi:catalase family peroxidase [Phreatobacter sp.]|uniref:catalase family peroxidase n=1 Tax=Phreatobacter sp. TaxID=1966341 RepID=UPI003F6F567A